VRAELRHRGDPDIIAIYGFDKRVLGWFVEVRHRGRLVVEYPVPGDRRPGTVAGIFMVLTEWDILTHDAIREATNWLGIINDLDEIEDEDVRRAAQVIIKLREMGSAEW